MYRSLSFLTVLLLIGTTALAAPSRLITSPPVGKGPNPNTGPAFDPLASQGQWFQRVSNGAFDVRDYEFHDNNDTPGTVGYQSILGNVANIITTGPVPGGNIVGFSIVATITNDLGGPDLGVPGRNLHDEFLLPGNNYVGTMYNVKMTADFALPSQVAVPVAVLSQIAANNTPYSAPNYGGGQNAFIQAQNEDQEAWYCYNNQANVPGGFYVPTFDFGNIAPGQSVTRTLNFTIQGAGIGPAHPLYGQLLAWSTNFTDVLMNRTSDLKIGDWLDVLAADSGFPYPGPAFNAGNVGVFFTVPEPTTFALLIPGALSLLRRRS